MIADQELVTVLVPDDPAQLALAESVLDEAGIAYAARSSEVQNLFGAGEIGAYNPAIGAVAIQVSAADLNRSRELLAEALGEEAALSGQAALPEDEEDAAPSPAEERFSWYSRASLAAGVLWIGGLGSVLSIYFGLKALALRREVPHLSTAKAVGGLGAGVLGLLFWLTSWGGALLDDVVRLGR
jgi:hypothetical protein